MTLKKLKKENKDKIQTNIMNLIFKKMKMSCHKNKKNHLLYNSYELEHALNPPYFTKERKTINF